MLKISTVSLEEINNTIHIPNPNAGFLRKLWAFSGPGALVAVGYMDPGNWITSIQGGALYSYLLLSVILISSLIAMLLQAMCVKIGVVTGMDLAQATKSMVGKKVSLCLWFSTELAIIATEIAEVIGSAVALNLLFDIPLLIGVLLTVFDVAILLILMRFGFRKIEAIVFCLIATIFIIFVYEVLRASPELSDIIDGFIPRRDIFTASIKGHDSALVIALGIVGATVMPHNLYLHSSIVQTRKYNRQNRVSLKEAIKYATIDSNIQLSFSFIINCLLLILGASLFYGNNPDDLGRFTQLYDALKDPHMVGPVASSMMATLFALALLASGQNATITGTLTGQIVMEGFIHLSIPLWARRIVSRGLAVTPVILCIYIWGDKENIVENLLIYTQVFLSIALPISMIPLILVTSNKKIMKEFVNSKITIMLGWIATISLVFLNLQLIYEIISSLFY
ncbi:Nramp family divalent metal transporter [Gilliamella sp. B2894]|uniref:Nramp family divalent metal transporter n=1 Tax=unclassified Gilliamella TaxID=2685620 RepID=UPI00226AAE1A|nr:MULTISPECIES: Nramp family divalent metal transporter [unclassified Gilliamella]MCX8656315.1 Nramp family divalent metal transporter [Gilliamella sp. B2894]MCX8693973.1 Nramp family divalent metal transporter [Gilliamella sp. B2881]MCX8696340.1 Nramp family divalent metal transporter [Gilliamella sp. B2828]